MRTSARHDRSSAKRLPLLEISSSLFVAVATLMAVLLPEDVYRRSAGLRGYTDSVAAVVRSIDQFTAISSFPGVTKVVLALLWTSVPFTASFFWLCPGVLQWDMNVVRRLGRLRWSIIAMILIISCVMPVILTLDRSDLESSDMVDLIIRFASTSRIGLGLVAGIYCVNAALLLALIPTYLNHRNYK